jgi:hypothetical protein
MELLKKIDLFLNESMSRYCMFYKAKNGKWYMELASDEYGEHEDATTYGPFNNEKEAEDYLDNFSNPGAWFSDKSGKQPVPKKSPNGRPVEAPVSQRDRLFGSWR